MNISTLMIIILIGLFIGAILGLLSGIKKGFENMLSELKKHGKLPPRKG
jgi:uncharacterized membrane protein YqgA involved in biofilm formation